MKFGVTVARDFTDDYNGWPVVNCTKASFADPKGIVSPRYWILWPGVFLMLVGSLVSLAVDSASIVKGFRDGYFELVNIYRGRKGLPPKYEIEEGMKDPAKPEDQVPVWAWLGSLAVFAVVNIVILSNVFGMNVGLAILALFLGFLFSFVGVQCAGSTDIKPISTVAKAAQLLNGGATHGKYQDHLVNGVGGRAFAMKLNLLSGLVAGAAAAQATDMTGDLKTGHLLKAKPRNQFVAQAAGALVSVFLFFLFAFLPPTLALWT